MTKNVLKKEMELPVKNILLIFKRNKRLFFLVSGMVFSISIIVYLFFLKPQYEVVSTVEIRNISQLPASLDDPMAFLLNSASGQNSSIDLDLLKSRTVLNMVIKELHLQMDVTKRNNSMFLYFLNKLRGVPDSNAHIVFKSFPDSLMSGGGQIEASSSGYLIYHKDKKAECKWEEKCLFNEGSVILGKIGEFSDNKRFFSFNYRDIIDTRDWLSSSLLVVPSEESSLISISFIHASSEMAALFIKNLIDSYKELKSGWNKEDEVVKMSYIKGVLDELQKDLDLKSQKMIVFQREKDTLIPEIQIEEMIKKRELLKIQLDEIDLKKNLMEESLKGLEKNPETPITAVALYNDISFQRALQTHNELIFKKNEILKNMTPQHPMIIAAGEEIQKSAQSLVGMFSESIKTIERSRDLVQKLLSLMVNDQKKLPENLFVFAELKRDIELAQTVFVTLSAKLYQASIDPSTGLPPIRVVDNPDPVVMKSSPKTSIFLLFLIFFTLLAGVVAVLIKDFFFIEDSGDKNNEES